METELFISSMAAQSLQTPDNNATIEPLGSSSLSSHMSQAAETDTSSSPSGMTHQVSLVENEENLSWDEDDPTTCLIHVSQLENLMNEDHCFLSTSVSP